jgi:hypothetical protein
MNDPHKQFQKVFDELYFLSITDKIFFLEKLLFYFTITGRGIWSDDKPADAEKVEAFKWLNELIHRVWNIRSALQRGEDSDSITRLYENMKFYGEQSEILRMHLLPTILGAFDNFIAR